jgi:hypothetical protein
MCELVQEEERCRIRTNNYIKDVLEGNHTVKFVKPLRPKVVLKELVTNECQQMARATVEGIGKIGRAVWIRKTN